MNLNRCKFWVSFFIDFFRTMFQTMISLPGNFGDALENFIRLLEGNDRQLDNLIKVLEKKR